ncbi:MAG TPA: hypothetical protein VIT64_08235 [Ilumatobacteraceae bacterium]
MIATSDPAGADARPPRSRPVLRVLLVVILALLAAMWIYAFLFAPKEGVNRIGDREWSDRAELRCAAAKDQLVALADMRTIDDVGEGALTEKAAIVDKTNLILTAMLDDLTAVEPTDEKGQEIIPLWLDDYRAYVADRRTYADRLRAGENPPFAESAVEGSPITGFINDVARQNNMPSCQAPVDLSA